MHHKKVLKKEDSQQILHVSIHQQQIKHMELMFKDKQYLKGERVELKRVHKENTTNLFRVLNQPTTTGSHRTKLRKDHKHVEQMLMDPIQIGLH
jgi:hypothetical protein